MEIKEIKYNVEEEIELERIVKVPSVACHIIPDLVILDQKYDILDYKVVKNHLFNEGKLSRAQISKIIEDSSKILKKEENIVRINSKCKIIGDLHGQFYDFVALLDNFNFKKDILLFLGDYVDRGVFGLEVYVLLLVLKTNFPKNIFILRGNHESERMTQFFSFRAECIHKYDESVYNQFVKSFMNLPLVGIIQNKIYCCHGGISKHIKYVDEINKINRKREISYEDEAMTDILWSDPNFMYETSKRWAYNFRRRVSYMYNYENVTEFLKNNNLIGIVRAHEVEEFGYKFYTEYNNFPSVTTIFSCPNYCDTYGNKGAYLEYDKELTVYTFDAVNHPYVLPGYLDGISWSFPFVSEKLYEFATELFKELEIDYSLKSEELAKNIAIMRMERECIDEFEDEESTVDCNACGVADEELDFEEAKVKDAVNEEIKNTSETVSITTEIPPSGAPNITEDITSDDSFIKSLKKALGM